jgi:hypothetical protein
MANIILTSTNNFKPFTYDEYIKPLDLLEAKHEALEDAYGDLESKASVWERLKDNPQDANVYNQYKKFIDDLRSQADALMREGLTPTSRRDLSKMKARYVAELNPIEEAWIKREADIKDYKTQLTKDPTLLSGDSNPMNASLTSYMNGNTPTYKYLSREDLYKQGLTAATALSKGKYNESKPVLDAGRQYWKMVTEQGYSPDEAAQWLANNGAFPEITAEVNRIKEAYNTAGLGSNSAAADSQIIRGIMDGLHAGYKKDVDRQINRSLNNNNNNPSDKGIFYDETGQGWKKIGEKLYKVNKEGNFELDNKGMPIVFTNKPDKPSDSNPTNNTFNQMDYSKLKGDILILGKDGKSIEYNLGTLLDPEKGNFKHIGTIAATVDNNIFDKDVLRDKLYSFNDNSEHKLKLDHISNKKARATSPIIVDPNSGELKKYDNSNITNGISETAFKQLDGDALEERFRATGALNIESSGDTLKYKVLINSSLGNLLKSTAKYDLTKGTGDKDSNYYILNKKAWDDFIGSNLLLLKAPNERHGLNDEGNAVSDILILQQQ